MTSYENGLGNYTAYTYDMSTTPNTADLIETDQYANGYSAQSDPTQSVAADGGDPITTSVYTTADNSSGVPLGLVYSTTDPDGLVSGFQYNSHGDTTATYNGQVLGPTVADENTTWTFPGIAPNADRTYDIYVQAESLPSLTLSDDENTSLTVDTSSTAGLPAARARKRLASVGPRDACGRRRQHVADREIRWHLVGPGLPNGANVHDGL